MENKKFLSQANELGPNCGKALRTETERRNLGVHLSTRDRDARELVLLITLLIVLVLL